MPRSDDTEELDADNAAALEEEVLFADDTKTLPDAAVGTSEAPDDELQ